MIGAFPFDSPLVHPACGTTALFPCLNDFYTAAVLVWTPEFIWPRAFPEGTPECPRCCSADAVWSNGFVPNDARRVVGERGDYFMTGYRYGCRSCKQANRDAGERTVPTIG